MLPIDLWPPLWDDPEVEVVGESLVEPFLDEPEDPARGSLPAPPVVPALALSPVLLPLDDDEGP